MDFRGTGDKPKTICILYEEVEVVEEYRYLGVYLDSSLDRKCNTEAL